MKVLALVILALSSAAAFRSGPYLPSGWKPQGPAFLLPGEVEKSTLKPEPESEPSGSDFLREYGPPKQTEDLSKQYLPEVATDQAFLVIRGNVIDSIDAVVVEENAVLKSTVQETTDSISTQKEEQVTNAQEDTNAELKTNQEVIDVTASVQDATEQITQQNPTAESLKAVEEEKLEETVESSTAQEEYQQEISTEKVLEAIAEEKAVTSDFQQRSDEEAIENVSSGVLVLAEQKLENSDAQVEVKNIAEAIANLDKEIKSVQVESQQIIGAKVEENSGSLVQEPGFLEYGPPGFREYGPPKEEIVEENKLENNEARKRRFSPKFKSTKAH